MMDEYEVEIAVPQANTVSNHIVVSGPVKRVEQAKLALERKVQQLDAEKEDRVSPATASSHVGTKPLYMSISFLCCLSISNWCAS